MGCGSCLTYFRLTSVESLMGPRKLPHRTSVVETINCIQQKSCSCQNQPSEASKASRLSISMDSKRRKQSAHCHRFAFFIGIEGLREVDGTYEIISRLKPVCNHRNGAEVCPTLFPRSWGWAKIIEDPALSHDADKPL